MGKFFVVILKYQTSECRVDDVNTKPSLAVAGCCYFLNLLLADGVMLRKLKEQHPLQFFMLSLKALDEGKLLSVGETLACPKLSAYNYIALAAFDCCQ